ncbi:MAG: YkgJ family cysteine cluster protein [Promethearchaeota archaeon]
MTKLKYKCMKCGTCCFEIPGSPGTKRIPLYPEEVDELIKIAKNNNLNFKVIEDLVFPDIINRKILVLTYRIIIDNENQCCPFYKNSIGCTIQNVKPLACQAYPLSLKRIDAFRFELSIDPLCNFVLENYENLKNINLERLKEIFEEEYPKAEKFYRKNKNLQLEIRRLEAEKKIKIPKEIEKNNYNKFLKEWDREEIIV